MLCRHFLLRRLHHAQRCCLVFPCSPGESERTLLFDEQMFLALSDLSADGPATSVPAVRHLYATSNSNSNSGSNSPGDVSFLRQLLRAQCFSEYLLDLAGSY
jgi:hypothetical protein